MKTKKHFYLRYLMPCLLLLLFRFSAHAQLDKGIWLAGGSGSFYSTKNDFSSTNASFNSKSLRISINPSIGYFPIDKLAVGLRTGYTKTKATVNSPGGGNTNENRLDIGPFGRLYFLEKDKQFNILMDAAYQYGFYWFTPTKGNRNTFAISAGTEVFFNSKVGIELLLGYYAQSEKIKDGANTTYEQKGLQMTIGFQFHLQK